jgi:hypothetical protein
MLLPEKNQAFFPSRYCLLKLRPEAAAGNGLKADTYILKPVYLQMLNHKLQI